MMEATKAIEGYWLSFDRDQEKRLHEILVQDGFSPDGAGLKAWIIDIIEGGAPDEPENEDRGNMYEFIREHPEMILNAGKFASNLVSGLMNKKRRA